MEQIDSLFEAIDQDVLEITQRMAGLELQPVRMARIDDAYTLKLTIQGVECFHLLLQMSQKTMRHIACHMNGGPLRAEESTLYVKEYFNILGGRIVSRINRKYKQNARFSLPILVRAADGLATQFEYAVDFSYHCQSGDVQLTIGKVCLPSKLSNLS